MTNGGSRPGSGRLKKTVDLTLPKRKPGRPTNAERAARLAAASGVGAIDPVVGGRLEQVKTPTLYTPEMAPDITPKDYFLTLMRDPRVSAERRDRAAQVAIGYVDVKPGEATKKVGVKEQRLLDAADVTAPGKTFAPGRAPLSVVGRK